jgi:hypothetical protein
VTLAHFKPEGIGGGAGSGKEGAMTAGGISEMGPEPGKGGGLNGRSMTRLAQLFADT